MSDKQKDQKDQAMDPETVGPQIWGKAAYICDRCGFRMVERNCKVECPNCGNRFDCSDLNIYFD